MMIIDNYIFGDIVAAKIPFTDGSEIKPRPVLILNKDGEDYLMLKITGNIVNKQKYDLLLFPDNINKLREDSLIKIQKIGIYAKEILIRKIGNLSLKERQIIKDNLKKFISDL